MYTEETPNPLALKFFLGMPIVEDGAYLFSSWKEASGIEALEDILSLPGIHSVLLMPEFITITKTDSVPWALLESVIFSVFSHHLHSFPLDMTQASGLEDPLQENQFAEWAPPTEEIASICQDIKDLINSKIKPAIEADGGMITFHAFENGIVYVGLHGACSECPHSGDTLKQGIEQTLTYYIPEVTEVMLVNSMNKEALTI